MLLNFGGFILSWGWTVIVCESHQELRRNLGGSNDNTFAGALYKSFSVNLVILAPLFNLLGGASHVMTALVYTEAALYTSDRYEAGPDLSLRKDLLIYNPGPPHSRCLKELSKFPN